MEQTNASIVGQLVFTDEARTTGGCLALIGQLREAQSFLEMRYAEMLAQQRRLTAPPAKPGAKRGRKPGGTNQRSNGRAADQSLPLEQPAPPDGYGELPA